MQRKKIWLTTDTHFHHPKCQELSHRPPNYEGRLIKGFQTCVSPGDMLIHLGDFILYNRQDAKSILDQIPGKKILVQGNHDRSSRPWYIDAGFDFVCDSFLWSFTWGNILFSHSPREVISADTLVLHGHLHDKYQKINGWSDETKKNYLISVENSKYQPMLLDTIINDMRKTNPEFFARYKAEQDVPE